MQDTVHKTLIIRFSSVGDIVLSSLLCRVLRRRFPESQIDFLVKAEFAGLVRNNPNLTNILEFPPSGSLRDLSRFRTTIRKAQYDLIVDAHGSLRSRMLTLGFRSVRRIRKRRLARALLVLFKWNLYALQGGAPSVAERYIEPVTDLGVADDGNGLDLYFDHASAAHAAELVQDTGNAPMIGICPSARHGNKMWIAARFAETAARLAERYSAGVMVFGSEGEQERCEGICTAIRNRPGGRHVINLAGKTTLLETASLMDRCSVIISNDSGLMHIAAARKRPTVAIFGPTVEEFGFFPHGTRNVVVQHPSLACRPCTHIGLPECPRRHFRCMNDIPVERVFSAAETLLDNR
jgi:lipopolysaccharide heptosyltransferase II